MRIMKEIKNVGRNDICSCGSGKKYKKCCIQQCSVNNEIADFAWRKLRQTEGSVIDNHLMPFTTQKLPNEVIETAMGDFFPDELPEGMDKELLFINFFTPWLLFNWIPLEDFGVEQFDPDITIALNYSKKYNSRLSSIEKRFIELISQTYYSFYSVLEIEFEKSIVVKDILLGTMHTLKERQGTHHLKRGDVIFSRILTMDEQSIFVGMAPFVIPTSYQNSLLDFKKWLIEENDNKPLTASVLYDELDMELVDYFFEIMTAVFNKPLPTLMNTDNELIQFSKSYFKLDISPEEALNKLLPLSLSKTADEILSDAERDNTETIKRIEFPWLKKGNKKHKSWENTIMGHVIIEGDRLTLDTNSEKRTQRGKKLLGKYLGEAIHFQQTLIESPEQKLRSSPKSGEANQTPSNLLEQPEVQEQIKLMAKKHWENWFDAPIPALDNKTPREAAKTEDGRERLEALLLQYERHDSDRNDATHFFKADINYLKSELALG